jgi:peptidoglycan/xylan/chitin deacetylase (PgdA/CDA1 family)
MLILTSWDDGHPCDLKLADMLLRHGLQGTFFVPRRNSEGRAVMSEKEIRQCGHVFEIACHTLDHVYLDQVNSAELVRQVGDSRIWLEDVLSVPVRGFCYPGGYVTRTAMRAVRQAGFRYARTSENFRCDSGRDPYRMPTTIQFYPHSPRVYLMNYLRYGRYTPRFGALRAMLGGDDFAGRLRDIALNCAERRGVFHLWGHSWEIEALGLWSVLDGFFAFLSSLPHQPKKLSEMWQ